MKLPFPLACALAAFTLAAPCTGADALRPWTEYRTIMWIGDSASKQPDKLPLFYQRLREMGINTAMVHHDKPSPELLASKMPFYVENMVNKGLCLKWSSKVQDWDKMVTAWKTPRDEAGLVRDYSLDDPEWKKWARGEMQRLVRANMEHQPVAYDIRDELSTTISANPFDYDFSPTALTGFREWLKTQYRDLAALNAGWETNFPAWDDVKPFTTDQIKNRMAGGKPDALGFPRGKPDWQAVQAIKFDPAEARKNPTRWNLSPWCDHRTYMDISLARTLGDLREAARELDPRTPVGIEGTQMPAAFGGSDLWRLSKVLDWIEPYDIGNAREIFGSFMPGKPILTTVGEQDARAAKRRLWHLLLEGDKGCIIWWSEDCIDWKSADYALTPRAKALAPVLTELQSPLARLFMRAEREVDPIAIHYSQASIQVDWLLESTEDGSTWLRRFSSYEASHNKMAKRRQAWVKLLQDAGYTPRFISTERIEQGGLKGVRALVLSDSLALSHKERDAVLSFRGSAQGFVLMGSNPAGVFNEHGRVETQPVKMMPGPIGESSPAPVLDTIWHDYKTTSQGTGSGSQSGGFDLYLAERLKGDFRRVEYEVSLLQKSLPNAVQTPREHSIRTHRYQFGKTARLVAFERNVVWQMGEDLKQRGGNEALEKPVTFDAKLSAAAHAYDLRTGKYLGLTDTLHVDLDPWQPSLFALTSAKLADGDIVAQLEKLAN